MRLHEKFIIFSLFALHEKTSQEYHARRKAVFNFLTSKDFGEAFEQDIKNLLKNRDIIEDPIQGQPWVIPMGKRGKFSNLLQFYERVEDMTDRYLVGKFTMTCKEICHRLKVSPQFTQDFTNKIVDAMGALEDVLTELYQEEPDRHPMDNEI